jgi:hypothetical protein
MSDNHKSITFKIDLGPMDWRLFQIQRSILINLVINNENNLTCEELSALEGILCLTDHIVDVAERRCCNIPDLNEIVLDRLASIKGDNITRLARLSPTTPS